MVMPGARQTRSFDGHHLHRCGLILCEEAGLIWSDSAMAPILQVFLKCVGALVAIPSTSASPIPRRSWIISSGGFSTVSHSGAASAAYGFIAGSRNRTRIISGGLRL